MAGENVAIWQVQSGAANGTESTATSTNTQLFNDTGKVIGNGAFTDEINIDFRRAVPENEAVNADNNELQDMGIQGLDITITGLSGNTNNDDAANLVNKFSKWLQDGNTTTGFTKGRFGLRLDNAPQWNVVPTSTYGYHIRTATFQYIGEKKDTVKFTISLGLGGDIATAI
ncbi:hypothetical protein LCGC14_2647350 [marine sediment metagenome]|uniref:Uncharacterized protein n=1 Tax=marine sediment metagenome TaxID=412755 RepID=A0A0F8ZVU9_9ZZZZ